MKLFFILVLFLFQSFSLFSSMGARFRNTVYSMDLTLPAADQLEKFESKKFKRLKNACYYLPELAVYPDCFQNHDQTTFGKAQTQEYLQEKYVDLLKRAPKELKLTCGGLCTYDHNEPYFSLVVKTRNKKAEYPLNFSISKQNSLQAYTQTDDGMIVMLLDDGSIEAYEIFNREIFKDLSLAQLVILAHVYAISRCIKGEMHAFIHPDWYEIYLTIPEEVIVFMFNNQIKIAKLD